MKHLDESGHRLLEYLVTHLPKAKPHDPRTFVGYKDVHDALGLPLLGSSYGVSLKSQGLSSLAEWTVDLGLPGITGLIVDRENLQPGDGYFKLFGFKQDPFAKWANEIARAKAFNWSDHLEQKSQKSHLQITAEPEYTPPQVPTIWRLIAHHESTMEALGWMERRNMIAIGWSEIGDLRELAPHSSGDIGHRIREVYPDVANSAQGGPSLWNLYHEVRIGDLVIVAAGKTRRVFEIVGDYFFSEHRDTMGYQHQRAAMLTSIDANELWEDVGRNVERGQNAYWTLAQCQSSDGASRSVYTEGARFEVRSTAVERNPRARRACIEHYGPRCFVCGFDFFATYGEPGKDFIHVHHRKDIALSGGIYVIDPVEHLIPLCPNCHAMVHREKPAMSVEALQNLVKLRHA